MALLLFRSPDYFERRLQQFTDLSWRRKERHEARERALDTVLKQRCQAMGFQRALHHPLMNVPKLFLNETTDEAGHARVQRLFEYVATAYDYKRAVELRQLRTRDPALFDHQGLILQRATEKALPERLEHFLSRSKKNPLLDPTCLRHRVLRRYQVLHFASEVARAWAEQRELLPQWGDDDWTENARNQDVKTRLAMVVMGKVDEHWKENGDDEGSSDSDSEMEEREMTTFYGATGTSSSEDFEVFYREAKNWAMGWDEAVGKKSGPLTSLEREMVNRIASQKDPWPASVPMT